MKTLAKKAIVGRRNPMRTRCMASVATSPIRSAQRVVPSPLPVIHVYDHCPYCVRVRLALGIKNVKHNVNFLPNDDFDTPIAMCGKKIAPILEVPSEGGDSFIMTESMDIVEYFDKDDRFGPTDAIKPASGRSDVKAWMKETKDLLRLLHRPRYMKSALPEFQQQDSRDYFVSSHPVPPFEKPEWKAEEFGMEKRWAAFDEAYARTAELIPELNKALAKLDDMIFCESYCTEEAGGISFDDIDLWARLRSVTMVKGAVFGDKTKAYLENLAEAGDCPLYFSMAC